jgi:hypothetical protein
MNWLAPLGFLGLISLIILVIIYIIKPNYQQKMISSTYIWKLSLKFRKKRIPINKLNNILIFLCQLLILTICSALLAQPVLAQEKIGDENEKIIIIDASASMLVSADGKGINTRFERAVDEAKLMVEQTVANGGLASVILADSTPEFLLQRIGADKKDDIDLCFSELLQKEGNLPKYCSFSSADMTGAMTLAEEVLSYNYEAQIHLYSATEYLEKNGVFVHNAEVRADDEWNVAILGCSSYVNSSNHCEISVDLGCYGGVTQEIKVYCNIVDANGKTSAGTVFHNPIEKSWYYDPSEEETTVVFTTDDFSGTPLRSFNYIEVYVLVQDSLAEDNSFFLYGGTKPTIRVQYASSVPNNYFGGVIRTIRQNMKNDWNIDFVELKADDKAATEVFDLYIYEHRMPSVIPTDGVVLLVDPTGAPEGAGIKFGDRLGVESSSTLAAGSKHELTQFVESSRITIAKYTEIVASDGYEELAYYSGKPVILAKEEDNAKIVVWAFDLNYSNIIAMPDFAFLMYNLFNYYIPTTVDSNSFEIGDTVELTARGTELSVDDGKGNKKDFEGKRGEITVATPGTYTVTQKAMGGDTLIIDNFFVSIPNVESDITKQVDQLPAASVEIVSEIEFEDLLFYFAIALVSLLFIEWMLQAKKNH